MAMTTLIKIQVLKELINTISTSKAEIQKEIIKSGLDLSKQMLEGELKGRTELEEELFNLKVIAHDVQSDIATATIEAMEKQLIELEEALAYVESKAK